MVAAPDRHVRSQLNDQFIHSKGGLSAAMIDMMVIPQLLIRSTRVQAMVPVAD